MSRAEELLNSVSEEVSVHTHPVPDTDTYFIIDPITRKIENTNRKKSVIMQYDHNSERFTFELPRFVDGHDMLECTSVTVNVDNIEVIEPELEGTVDARINSDAPDMTDLRIHPNDPEKVISSWLISRNSTQLPGILSFHIEYKCVDSDGDVVYEWGTDTYDEIEVKARKKNGEAVVSEYSDLLEQWRTRIFGEGDSVVANIVAEGNTQIAAVKAESETQQEAVELKGAQTLGSIPEDYTEVDAMADEAVRTKSDAIVCEVAGESIVLKDSSNDHIRGLKIFGKSTQVTTTGKNLLSFSYKDLSKTENGVTLTVNGDGSISFSGTAKGYAGIPLYEGYASVFPNVITIFALGVFSNAVLHIVLVDKNGSTILETNLTSATTYRTIDFSQYTDVERITINAKRYDAGAVSGTIYPMIVSGEMNSATYEPYTGGKPGPNPDYPQDIVSIENPTVDMYGKNLCPPSAFNVMNTNGSANTYNPASNTITMDVDSTTSSGRYCAPCKNLIVGKPYTLSFDIRGTADKKVTCGWNIGKLYVTLTNEYVRYSSTIIASHPSEAIIFYSYVASGGGLLSGEFIQFANVQIEFGETATSYEPYKPVQTLSFNHTLPGIPVTSGGNYTDSDGQQWICDDIDFERGVYVQRIKTVILDGSDNEGWMLYNNNVDQGMSFVYYPYDGVKYFQSSICDKYRNVIGCWGEPYKGQMGVYSDHNSVSGRYFRPPNESVDSLEAWLSWLADNPLSLMYILATPIETPLTAEEITAFKALRTNYPNTTILNDADAHMSVKYNADTKLYVDNKITDAINSFLAEHQIG